MSARDEDFNELDELALHSIHDDAAVEVVDGLTDQVEEDARRLGVPPEALLARMGNELKARAS